MTEPARRGPGRPITDLTNHPPFGRLTAIRMDERKPNEKKIYWLCKCSCGNPELFRAASGHLLAGETTHCGCNHKNPNGDIPGLVIRTARLKANLSQVRLAKAMGVSRQRVHQIENTKLVTMAVASKAMEAILTLCPKMGDRRR